MIGTGTQSGAPDNNIGYGIAQGLDALSYGAAVVDPPRMTLPFELLSPADGASVNTVTPVLLWSASIAAGLDLEMPANPLTPPRIVAAVEDRADMAGHPATSATMKLPRFIGSPNSLWDNCITKEYLCWAMRLKLSIFPNAY